MVRVATYHFKRAAVFIFLFVCIRAATFAQDTALNTASTQRFLKIGLGPGTAKNFGFYVSLLVSPKWFYTLDFNAISRIPAYTPTDYYGPIICIFGNCMPKEEFNYTTFFAGCYFVNKHKLRFGAAAGPSFVNYKEVIFAKHEEEGMGFNFGPDYDISYKNHTGAGIGVKTMIGLRVLKKLWLEPTLYANINTQHTTCSGNLFISLDFPVGRRKHKA